MYTKNIYYINCQLFYSCKCHLKVHFSSICVTNVNISSFFLCSLLMTWTLDLGVSLVWRHPLKIFYLLLEPDLRYRYFYKYFLNRLKKYTGVSSWFYFCHFLIYFEISTYLCSANDRQTPCQVMLSPFASTTPAPIYSIYLFILIIPVIFRISCCAHINHFISELDLDTFLHIFTVKKPKKERKCLVSKL